MFRSSARRTLTLLAAASVLALVAGCGRDMALNPVDDFTGQPILLPASERPVPSGGPQGQELPSVTVRVSAAEGGRVSMGRYTLDFPPGALAQDTLVTIRQADPAAMIVELEPHGIQFSRPVTLSASVGGLTAPGATTVGVAWRNPETGRWEMVGESSASTGRASAGLWHFSDYEAFSQ